MERRQEASHQFDSVYVMWHRFGSSSKHLAMKWHWHPLLAWLIKCFFLRRDLNPGPLFGKVLGKGGTITKAITSSCGPYTPKYFVFTPYYHVGGIIYGSPDIERSFGSMIFPTLFISKVINLIPCQNHHLWTSSNDIRREPLHWTVMQCQPWIHGSVQNRAAITQK